MPDPTNATADSAASHYAGRYELAPNFIITVSREGTELFARGTGQPRFSLYAKSDEEFLSKDVPNASITFEGQPHASATALVLHQNGRDLRGARIDEATAKALEDAVAKRFRDQTAQPGGEAFLRLRIEELQHNQVNYDEFAPELAAAVREQLPHTEAFIATLGAFQSITFKGVGPGGADIYQATFANGVLEWRQLLGADGKAVLSNVRKLP